MNLTKTGPEEAPREAHSRARLITLVRRYTAKRCAKLQQQARADRAERSDVGVKAGGGVSRAAANRTGGGQDSEPPC